MVLVGGALYVIDVQEFCFTHWYSRVLLMEITLSCDIAERRKSWTAAKTCFQIWEQRQTRWQLLWTCQILPTETAYSARSQSLLMPWLELLDWIIKASLVFRGKSWEVSCLILFNWELVPVVYISFFLLLTQTSFGRVCLYLIISIFLNAESSLTEQDEGLEQLEETVMSTKHIALTVNEELELHTRLIVQFLSELDCCNTLFDTS